MKLSPAVYLATYFRVRCWMDFGLLGTGLGNVDELGIWLFENMLFFDVES
jgi:hypothetical protein